MAVKSVFPSAISEEVKTLQTNLAINTLNDVIVEGRTVFDMVDQVADAFTDQTGIDTATSSNEIYDSANDYYTGGSTASYPIGFAETDVPSSTSAQTYFVKLSDLGLTGTVQCSTIAFFIGSSGASSLTVNFLTATPNGSNWDITHRGSESVSGSDGDEHVFTLPTPVYLNASTDMIGISSVGSGSWHRWASGGSSLEFTTTVYSADSSNQSLTTFGNTPSVHGTFLVADDTNFTLVSDSFTADSAPTHARIVAFYDPVDSVTLNTDLIFSVSIDGGTTFANATMEYAQDYTSDIRILTCDEIDLSSITSGTSVVIKATTANTRELRIHGWVIQWR